MIHFKSDGDDHLPLIKFAYDNRHDSTIVMAPFEALYEGNVDLQSGGLM